MQSEPRILVIAGNHSEYLGWLRGVEPSQRRRYSYLSGAHQLRGLRSSDVRLVKVGTYSQRKDFLEIFEAIDVRGLQFEVDAP